MKNLLTLVIIAMVVGAAIGKGVMLLKRAPVSSRRVEASKVPHIGRLEVLNGCGTEGIAHSMASFLRENHFDVKNIGNAEHWNFPETMVISRTSDTTIAAQVAAVLKTRNMVLIRTRETLYDATVIVGPDYRERIQ